MEYGARHNLFINKVGQRIRLKFVFFRHIHRNLYWLMTNINLVTVVTSVFGIKQLRKIVK